MSNTSSCNDLNTSNKSFYYKPIYRKISFLLPLLGVSLFIILLHKFYIYEKKLLFYLNMATKNLIKNLRY